MEMSSSNVTNFLNLSNPLFSNTSVQNMYLYKKTHSGLHSRVSRASAVILTPIKCSCSFP